MSPVGAKKLQHRPPTPSGYSSSARNEQMMELPRPLRNIVIGEETCSPYTADDPERLPWLQEHKEAAPSQRPSRVLRFAIAWAAAAVVAALLSTAIDRARGDNRPVQLTVRLPPPRSSTEFALTQDHRETHRLIFGSQIKALEVAARGDGRMSRNELKALYVEAASKFPRQYRVISFRQWREFFLTQGLAQGDHSGDIQLSAKGFRFVAWLSVRGTPGDRLL
jgi:hypothetical protein